MALKYTEKVLEYFRNPKNVGNIKDADAKATEGSPACGDMMMVTLKINPKTLVIEDIKFKSYGCASNIATASIITELAKGMTLAEAKKLTWDAAAKELGGLPPVKMHCSVLAVNTLKAAIKDYEVKHGLYKEDEVILSKEFLHKELEHVMNPEIGVNIVRLKMVKNIKISSGKITVEISMGNTDEMYKNAIVADIKEHLEGIKDIKKVEVKVV